MSVCILNNSLQYFELVILQVALGLFCEVSHKRQKLNGLFVKSAQEVLRLNPCEERTEICIYVMADRFCSLNQSTCNVGIERHSCSKKQFSLLFTVGG